MCYRTKIFELFLNSFPFNYKCAQDIKEKNQQKIMHFPCHSKAKHYCFETLIVPPSNEK